MIFQELSLAGAYAIHMERAYDERGYFARTFCRKTFIARGLKDCGLQCSVSFSGTPRTLRGLHFQIEPYGETKLVRCSRGTIFDVIVDIRRNSPSFGHWHSQELSADNGIALYVPNGFAHGFLTLTGDAEVYYQMAEEYVPESASGLRWDDPDIAIRWPASPSVISPRDAQLPRFRDLNFV